MRRWERGREDESKRIAMDDERRHAGMGEDARGYREEEREKDKILSRVPLGCS